MAMLFSGIKTVPLLAVPSGRVDGVILSDIRWKKVKELTTIASAATTKASTTRDLGRRGRRTMNPHSQPNMRMISQGSAYFQRASHRLLRTAEKKECHPVSSRHSDEFARCFCSPKTFGASHDLIEVLQQFNLLIVR